MGIGNVLVLGGFAFMALASWRALEARLQPSVAGIDGMRFVVPVPSLFAKPNRKYFGPKRGMTFLNAINDQAFGIGHKIVARTDRDCLHAIDLFFGSGVANLPEVLVTDTASYGPGIRDRAAAGRRLPARRGDSHCAAFL